MKHRLHERRPRTPHLQPDELHVIKTSEQEVDIAYTVYELATLANAVYYKGQTAVGDWRRASAFGDPAGGGFYAALYTRGDLAVLAYRGTDEMWDYGPDAEILLGQIPWQFPDAQLAMVRSRAGLRRNAPLAITGHSLGGALACLIAAKSGLPCVTFNAPGVARSYAAGARATMLADALPPVVGPVAGVVAGAVALANVDSSKILNIRATYDVVSIGTGPQLGRVETIAVAGCAPVKVDRRKESLVSLVLSPGVMVAEGAVLSGEIAAKAGSYVLCQHGMELMELQLRNIPRYNKDLGW